MNREAHDAEQLNAAMDAVAGGATPEQASSGLPEDLRRLADTGDWFRRAGAEAGPRPRPAFMLGLEDQLRTDLRLGPYGRGSGPEPASAGGEGSGGGRLPGLLSAPRRASFWLALLAIGGLFLLTQRAGPGDMLYGSKRLLERTAEQLAPSPRMRADICLDRGWRRLEETEALLAADESANPQLLEQLLSDLVEDYRLALDYAAATGDDRAGLRAASEIEITRDRLEQLVTEATPDESSLLVDARAALESARLRLGLVGEPGAPPATPTSQAVASSPPPALGSATAPSPATATAAVGDPLGTEPATASPTASASPSASPSPTRRSLATASASPPAPSPTASATASQAPPAPTDKPKKPAPTRVPPTATSSASTAEPSRTPDAWATREPGTETPSPGPEPGAGSSDPDPEKPGGLGRPGPSATP